jgi:hypothetical protein
MYDLDNVEAFVVSPTGYSPVEEEGVRIPDLQKKGLAATQN